jgi:hypothetical protein
MTTRCRCWWSHPGKTIILIVFPLDSVADPGCLPRIPDPVFYPARITDPKTAIKERDEKKFVDIPFFAATNFT